MPITAPVWAKEAANIPTITVSKPRVWTLLIIIGVMAQCRPKITSTCHNPPTSTPSTTGLNRYTAIKPAPIRLEAKEATGPITQNVMHTVTKQVMSGRANSLTVSGINLLYRFSNQAANATAQIIGTTLLA